MAKAMIVSVGGSPQPIIKSINHYQPAFICFFVSDQSVEQVAAIRQGSTCSFVDGKAYTADINDLLACYQGAIVAAEQTEAAGYAACDIVVDYTGGTKSMTAALVLATVARGYTFSYVGGEKRTKGGIGQVENGFERPVEVLNPWEVLAIQEQTRLASLFNKHQFTAAAQLLRDVRARTRQDERLRRVFGCLLDLIDGYTAWDRFAHSSAAESLRRAAKPIGDYALLLADQGLQSFAAEVEGNLVFFNRLSEATHGFRSESLLCLEMVIDLIANAERRAAEHKYDDAVARLYRALEMAAQAALLRRDRKFRTEAMPLVAIPIELRDEFARRYSDGGDSVKEKIKLGLEAGYQLLSALGDPLGRRYQERQERMQGLLFTRNSSILAHGVTPIKPETYEGLLESLLEMLELQREQLPRFAQLKLELHLLPQA